MGAKRLQRKLAAGYLPSGADSRAFLRSCFRSVVRGFAAMGRPGVHFTAEQSEQIRSLAEAGQGVAAQRVIARPDGLDDLEGRVMDHLVAAVNAYGELPPGHPSEPHEFACAVHHLQDLLAARAMRRLFPEGWR